MPQPLKETKILSEKPGIDKNCVCPFCRSQLKNLPAGLNVKEIIMIAKRIAEGAKESEAVNKLKVV